MVIAINFDIITFVRYNKNQTSIEGLLCLSNDNNELDTVLKEGVTYNGKTLSSTDIIALKAFLQGLIANK